MAIFKQVVMTFDKRFDARTCRHSLNGENYVLHCHHFTTLYSQLAEDAKEFGGIKLLRDTAEDAFYNTLKRYYADNGITNLSDMLRIAEEYYSCIGMGKISFASVGEVSGHVVLSRSHVDEGWIKKFGKREQPINYITHGYVSAVFALVNDQPVRSFTATEVKSIVAGAPESEIQVYKN